MTTDPSPQDPSDAPIPRTLVCLFFPLIMLLFAVTSVAVPLATSSVASRDKDLSAVLGVGPSFRGNNFGRFFLVHNIYTCIANAAISIGVLARVFCWSRFPGRKAATFDYVVLFVSCLLSGVGVAFCPSKASGSPCAGIMPAEYLPTVVAMSQGAAVMTLVPVAGLAMRSEAKSPLPLGILFAASLVMAKCELLLINHEHMGALVTR
ncbi:hypothetical protein CTA2_931 [Colletotrichum tanaceti]|uniref:Uncharacterized protein n=1 Tax=Colletotrichum tanaceti TaxID=1306861 RepID=A0A4U6XHK8_9PEZI|nr:hypothetical protein CTA2_931 [Colletotrichum tanaceti]TKW55231.1 hypothetical protein CTA1_3312 [Colletotrichum tanaceti]